MLTNVAYSNTTSTGTWRPAPQSQEATPPTVVAATIVHSAGYLAPATQVLGTIFHTVEERAGIAEGDQAVIDAGANKNLHPGDRVTIIRTSTVRRHTMTQPALDTLTAVLGTATVVSVQPTTAVVRITQAFDTIGLGDQVKAFEPPQPLVASASLLPQARRELSGFIVATQDNRVVVGTGDIVYLDRGKRHGVEVGDRFNILQEHQTLPHPTTRHVVQLPQQILGALTVLNVHAHTSTGLITASQREFSTGTPVELRRDTALAAAPQMPDALSRQAEALLSQLPICLEVARQVMHTAEAAGATEDDLASAKRALSRAAQLSEQVQALLASGEVEQALSLLQTAQADCLAAQDLSRQARLVARSRAPAALERYSVVRGDTLWSIAAKPTIYRNPFMWPLIYRANRTQLPDPDRIFPRQLLTIPRNYSPEEANTAIQRARARGRWRQGDGPDVYILEGVRR